MFNFGLQTKEPQLSEAVDSTSTSQSVHTPSDTPSTSSADLEKGSKSKFEMSDQTNLLPRSQLFLVFGAMAFCMLVSFMDQNGISVALPDIAKDLNAEDTISWAGTSGLIANTVFQVLYGRLSDIFGRKVVFMIVVCTLVVGDIGCACAQTSTQLYVFRAFSGIANGGMSCLTMIVVSDIVTLKERGKYQGILGACVGLGNTIGPFLGAAFTENVSWRAIFYLLAPMGALCAVIIFFILPSKKPQGSALAKAKAIDYPGLFCSSVALVFLLIPIAGGGSYYEWNSPMVISMLCIGGVFFIAFFVIEGYYAKLPMMPLRIFGSKALFALMMHSVLLGIAYYGDLYYLPMYMRNIRGWSSMKAAGMSCALVTTQAVTTVISGQYLSRVGRYLEVIYFGFGIWTIGAIMKCFWKRDSNMSLLIFSLLLEGAGVGCCFQPTLVAAQALSRKEDRSVVISSRNFLRSFGGAVGLAVCSAILANSLKADLKTKDLPQELYSIIIKSPFSLPDLSQYPQYQDAVLDAYMKGSHTVFVFLAPMVGACLLVTVFVKDYGLNTHEKKPETAVEELSESGTDTEDDKNFVMVSEKGKLSSASSMHDMHFGDHTAVNTPAPTGYNTPVVGTLCHNSPILYPQERRGSDAITPIEPLDGYLENPPHSPNSSVKRVTIQE